MLYNLQALRAAAAFLVVLVHMEKLWGPIARTHYGRAGVDLFFVISGFVMVYTTDLKPLSPGAFMRLRLIRIVPLYWFITLLVGAAVLVKPSLFQSTTADPVSLIKSLLFIPFLKGNGEIHPVVFVGWTLNYEMFFYVLFAASLFVAGRWRRIGLVAMVLTGLTALGLGAGDQGTLGRFYTNPMIMEFLFGMLLAASVGQYKQWRLPAWVPLGAILTGGLLLVCAPRCWPYLPRVLACGLPAVLIVWGALALEFAGHAVRSPWVQLLGAASYAIYLSHFFVTQLFIAGKTRLDLQALPAVAGLAGLCLVTVALVGVGIHLAIEQPLLGFLRRRTGRGQPVASTGGGG